MRARALALVLLAATTTACGGAGGGKPARVGDAERARAAAKGRPAETQAPQLFAAGDLELQAANAAVARGDGARAELHAERAIAAYAHAAVLARLALATTEDATASAERARLEDLARKHAAMRAALDREAQDLERRLKIAREAELPAPSGRADPEREKARGVAARSLVAEARLLCGAARLVSESAPGLAEAESTVTDLEKRLDAPGRAPKATAPIDEAARARAACLAALTKARRPAATRVQDEADALLAELASASAATTTSPRLEGTPSRDERGVVMTLPDASTFKGDALTAQAKDALAELGRVAAAHPTFGLQVVLHDDAARPTASLDARGRAVTDALVGAGAGRARVRVENAGTRARVIDPSSKDHARNARVEVVFVPTGAS